MDEEIQRWENCALLDTKMVDLLRQENAQEDYFGGRVEFGTGGMRGLIGPGPNRINELTIARVTAGLGDLLLKEQETAKVIIGYDNRFFSRRFAEIAGSILAAQNIQVFIFNTLTPTPIVSYSIRKMQAQAGIVITASHNAKEYNGYKVYDDTGCQILPDRVDRLNRFAEKYQNEFEFSQANQRIIWLDETLENAYLSQFQEYIDAGEKNITIGYSPEQGTGGRVVKKLFKTYHFDKVYYPDEQWSPDPAFSNTKSPNPEDASAFEVLLNYGKKYNLDLLLATDPDADRLGAFYRNDQAEFIRLTGNQIGAILLQYLLDHSPKDSLESKYIVKTIVSSNLAKKIAQMHGLEVIETLTGFKYIGDTINKKGKDRFFFAYEESFGFLVNPIVRDKDGLQIALILAEVANSLKQNGENLGTYLDSIYKNYGYYSENAISIALPEKNGKESQNKIYEQLSETLKKEALVMEDYQTQRRNDLENGTDTPIALPKATVRKFYFEDNSWVCIRPSGTESKLKIYLGVVSNSAQQAQEKLKNWTNRINEIIEK